MLPDNINNLSVYQIAQILQSEANSDPTKWKPLGYVSYPKIISKLGAYLRDLAKAKLTADKFSRIIIKVDMERDTGAITVSITERQRYLPSYKETRLALRPESRIVIWTGKRLLIDIYN